MMRWLAAVLGLVLVLGASSGCNRQCFLSKEVFDQAHEGLLPPGLEEPGAGEHAVLTPKLPTPADIECPDRPPRYISLQEAIAIALENGTTSGRGGQPGGGIYDLNLVNVAGGGGIIANQTDYIRVLALQPAIAGANIEAALARFDAFYLTSMNWSVTDNLQQGLQSFQNGQSAQFQSGIVKQLATGGVAGVISQVDYRNLSTPPTGNFNVLNPSYTTRLIFGVEQPLWRDFGVDINQLLSRTPSASGNGIPGQFAGAFNGRQQGSFQGGQGQVGNDGILIARVKFDQQRADFERNVHLLLLNVEGSYWRLYQAYGRLYAFEEVLRIAHRAWMIAQAQYQAGKIGPSDFAPVRAQFEEFRGERAAALGEVLDRERNLRGLIGLPIEDGTRLIPITPPTLAPYAPEWHVALHDALNLRPELVITRQNIRLQQYNLEVQRNFLKPDLRFSAQYQPVGFGNHLAGGGTFTDATGAPRPESSLESLASGAFADWNVGLTLSMPIGFRFENAAVRAARLNLVQGFYLLKDQEMRATHTLTNAYQKVIEWNKLIETRRAERKAYADAVEARFKKYQAGGVTPDFLLEAQRRLATAQVKEYEAIAEYNAALARLEWAKGTIMKYDNVHIAEGPLPQCVQLRAVENERERSRALVIRERPEPLAHPGRLASPTVTPPLDAPVRTVPLPGEPAPVPLPALPGEKLDVLPTPPRELPKELGKQTAPAGKDEGQAKAEAKKAEAKAKTPAPVQPAAATQQKAGGEKVLPAEATEPIFRAMPSSRANPPLPSASPSLPTLTPLPDAPASTAAPGRDSRPAPKP